MLTHSRSVLFITGIYWRWQEERGTVLVGVNRNDKWTTCCLSLINYPGKERWKHSSPGITSFGTRRLLQSYTVCIHCACSLKNFQNRAFHVFTRFPKIISISKMQWKYGRNSLNTWLPDFTFQRTFFHTLEKKNFLERNFNLILCRFQHHVLLPSQ